GKKFDTELKAFRSCIKDAAPAMNQAAIDGCIATGVNDAKAQSTVQPKLQADMASQCTFPVPAGMDDGNCSGCTSATTCATCVGDIVDCEACEAMNGSSNSFVNCDLLDDGNANSSCPPPCPGGQVVGGFCWFLGALGQDCDDACASHGLTYSAATQTYAGSGGSATLANCQTVMTALGEGTTFIDFGSCFDGFGCARNVPVSQYYRCTNIPTNSTAVHPTGERACACQ
ncbi:MAG: hypothetical protein ACREJT_04555, partial [Myxococcota bacterium]